MSEINFRNWKYCYVFWYFRKITGTVWKIDRIKAKLIGQTLKMFKIVQA